VCSQQEEGVQNSAHAASSMSINLQQANSTACCLKGKFLNMLD
jgi:hypothetical protein